MNKHCVAATLIFAVATLPGSVFAQQVPDLPLETVPKQCVTAEDGTRVCKPPVNMQPKVDDADRFDAAGGCTLEDGGWVCDSQSR